jgi:hypothetical protein
VDLVRKRRNPGKENGGTWNRELDIINAKLRLARFSEHGSTLSGICDLRFAI